MMLTFRFSEIAKMLGCLAFGSLVIGGWPAAAAIVYDLAANPPAVTVMQGQSGTDTITVTLSQLSNENAAVQIPTASTIMWQFLSGDQMDAVTDATITGGSCFLFNKAGAIFGTNTVTPGGDCTIIETFKTGDLRNPDPDTDKGTWAVQSALAMKGLTSNMTLAKKVSFQAIVTDPVQAPEPGTIALFGIGLIGIGLIVRRLRPSGCSGR